MQFSHRELLLRRVLWEEGGGSCDFVNDEAGVKHPKNKRKEKKSGGNEAGKTYRLFVKMFPESRLLPFPPFAAGVGAMPSNFSTAPFVFP